jgi:hypothetical protein
MTDDNWMENWPEPDQGFTDYPAKKTITPDKNQLELFPHGYNPPKDREGHYEYDRRESYHAYIGRRLKEERENNNLSEYKYKGMIEEAIADIKSRLKILEKNYADLYLKGH